MKKKYVLTLRVDLDARDDPEARMKARLAVELIGPLLSDRTVGMRLQELFPNKPPRKVAFDVGEA